MQVSQESAAQQCSCLQHSQLTLLVSAVLHTVLTASCVAEPRSGAGPSAAFQHFTGEACFEEEWLSALVSTGQSHPVSPTHGEQSQICQSYPQKEWNQQAQLAEH